VRKSHGFDAAQKPHTDNPFIRIFLFGRGLVVASARAFVSKLRVAKAIAMPFAGIGSNKDAAVVVACGLVRWALCGVTMGVGMKVTTLEAALIFHAVAAPVIFTAISLVYFRRLRAWSPPRTAAAFLGVVVVMDFFVVALLIERSFEMFESILGTWLPFVLIFISTWWTGLAVWRTAHRAAV
jgi:hypothetical protein